MSNQLLTVRNPFDLEVIAELERPDWAFADKWLDWAVTLHRQRDNWLPAYQRMAILRRASALMRDRFEDLVFQIANEGGKPLIDARIEVKRAIDGVGLAVEGIGHLNGSRNPDGPDGRWGRPHGLHIARADRAGCRGVCF